MSGYYTPSHPDMQGQSHRTSKFLVPLVPNALLRITLDVVVMSKRAAHVGRSHNISSR